MASRNVSTSFNTFALFFLLPALVKSSKNRRQANEMEAKTQVALITSTNEVKFKIQIFLCFSLETSCKKRREKENIFKHHGVVSIPRGNQCWVKENSLLRSSTPRSLVWMQILASTGAASEPTSSSFCSETKPIVANKFLSAMIYHHFTHFSFLLLSFEKTFSVVALSLNMISTSWVFFRLKVACPFVGT